MTIHASRAPETPRLRALVSGGVDEYLRMLRMLVWAVVPLGVTAPDGLRNRIWVLL